MPVPTLTIDRDDILSLACACGDGVKLTVDLRDVPEATLRKLREAINEWIGE